MSRVGGKIRVGRVTPIQQFFFGLILSTCFRLNLQSFRNIPNNDVSKLKCVVHYADLLFSLADCFLSPCVKVLYFTGQSFHFFSASYVIIAKFFACCQRFESGV